jgi:hypothetical protein
VQVAGYRMQPPRSILAFSPVRLLGSSRLLRSAGHSVTQLFAQPTGRHLAFSARRGGENTKECRGEFGADGSEKHLRSTENRGSPCRLHLLQTARRLSRICCCWGRAFDSLAELRG